jgi:acyl carrier protein
VTGEASLSQGVGGEPIEAQVLAILRELSAELQAGRAPIDVTRDTVLDRDLGIDSLARVELVMRLERAFAVDLPEDRIMQAGTAADLVATVAAAGPRAALRPVERETITPRSEGLAEPRTAVTLLDALEHHLVRHPDQPHLRLLHPSSADHVLTYAALWQGAQAVAAGLREYVAEQGQTVAIMLPTSVGFFFAFLGTVLAGGVPVPIYPPTGRRQIEEHLRRQAGILGNAEARVLITTSEAVPFGQLIKAQVETVQRVATVEALSTPGEMELRPPLTGETVALLQYTSGSTGSPKGVILTHNNLLSNIRGLGRAFDVNSGDVVVSWLPLYHDMGLIGSWLGSLYYGFPLVVMSPLSFLGRPERWLWAIHRFQGTLSAGPNFAYELCVRKIPEETIEALDLSSWRMAGNGAEAVQAATVETFANRFERYGFRRQAMTPMYGLAESSVALTIAPPGRGARFDRIARGVFTSSGYAEPARKDDPTAMTFVGSGVPIAGHEIRIVDPTGVEAGDRQEGHIQFRGPSATQGYFRSPEKTAELFDGKWLNTGDTGYIDGGEIFVTGRIKDIIVRAGRNLYPEEIENAVGEIPGVRKGRIAAFASPDPETGTERLIVVAETRVTDAQARHALEQQILDRVTTIVEMPPEEIVLARPGAILKTANGKLRRAACRSLYEEGRLGLPPPVLRRQIAGLVRASIVPEMRRFRRAASAFAYAAYFQLMYRTFGPLVWLAIAVTPGTLRRKRLFRWASNLLLRLLWIVPEAKGLEQLPRHQPYVLAVNHESYLDGLVLAAILPGDYAFTVKRELVGQPVAGPFLKRIGVAFVERLDVAGGVEDMRRLAKILRQGQPLVVFPEGTFDRRPGLRAFHMGAFVLAAETGVPVLPAAIRGTRSILRGNAWFARRGSITVTFEPPVEPDGSDWGAAVRLRDRVRSLILKGCGEPDLAYEPTALSLRAAEAGRRKNERAGEVRR